MPSLDYVHVDVFTDRPYGGNSLPVFPDAGGLDAAEMLAITRELRHFEAVFLAPTDAPRTVKARVFDLWEELPFAGHPLIGAAAVLRHRTGDAGEGRWTFRLGERAVSVDVATTAHGYAAVLDQGRPQFLGAARDRHGMAEAFGLDAADLHPELPLEAASTGLRYLVAPLAPGALERVAIGQDITERLHACGAQFAVLFDPAAKEIRHITNDGRVEDAATGSAAGVIGAYALKHGLVRPGERLTLRQGRFVGRPSLLQVFAEGSRDAVTSVKVGGDVALVGRGVLDRRPGAFA